MLYVLITAILANDVVELIPIHEGYQLSENVFILMHLLISLGIAKMQIEIRLIVKQLQLTKFQIFQRTHLDFNGTVMIRNIENLNLFSKFVKLAAARSGQILNVNNLANETGVDNKTISAWISVLESSYIVYRLQPYYNNFNKRIIKSPKLYFYDVGLLCNILGLNSEIAIKNSNMYDAIFENLVISEIKKNRFNKNQYGELYYLRDSTGNEVDLVLEKDGNLIPVEIKSAAKYKSSDLKNLKWFQRLYRIKGGILINQSNENQELEDGIMNISWAEVAKV